jgi:hypothetical protein
MSSNSYGAEFAEQVDGPVVRHVTQLDKALVRLKICVQDFFG